MVAAPRAGPPGQVRTAWVGLIDYAPAQPECRRRQGVVRADAFPETPVFSRAQTIADFDPELWQSIEDEARRLYAMLGSGQRAEHCQQCGECDGKCPQHIAIQDQLADVARVLGERATHD